MDELLSSRQRFTKHLCCRTGYKALWKDMMFTLRHKQVVYITKIDHNCVKNVILLIYSIKWVIRSGSKPNIFLLPATVMFFCISYLTTNLSPELTEAGDGPRTCRWHCAAGWQHREWCKPCHQETCSRNTESAQMPFFFKAGIRSSSATGYSELKAFKGPLNKVQNGAEE